MRVAVHKAGQDHDSVAINHLVAGLRRDQRSAGDNLSAIETQVASLDTGWIDVRQDGVAKNRAHYDASTILATASIDGGTSCGSPTALSAPAISLRPLPVIIATTLDLAFKSPR